MCAILLVETACIFLFLIATVQISMEYETQESLAGYKKHLNLYQPKTFMCWYRVKQDLIVLNLCSISIIKILVRIYY